MFPEFSDILTTACGSIVGVILGLIGGGGSILALPLLIYVVGMRSPHLAIGTSAIAVSASAFGNLMNHWHAGNVKWRCSAVFATAGMAGAFLGSSVAKALDGQKLLAAFGLLMMIIGLAMLRHPASAGDPDVRLSLASASRLLPALLSIGFGVGVLAGFFGIGGGFLIVPGLILATGMPLTFAIGTSLVAVTAFGATTAMNYARSDWVDWRLSAFFVLGGLLGGLAGITLGRHLAGRKQALQTVFASIVIATGIYILVRSAFVLI